MSLIENLKKEEWLKTPEIIEAFEKIKRKDFLPQDKKDMAELNRALPIGFGQTISQPLVVAFMLELLSPQKGENILDIGSGSGWTSVLLSELVGEKGRVTAVEIVPELVEFGKRNASKYSFIKKGILSFKEADGSKGYKENAPYDKILCSAEIQSKLPKEWKNQLKDKGKIVSPMDSSIFIFQKKQGNLSSKKYHGFSFVPLIEK